MHVEGLQGKHIVLGVTGGIAAYKSAELVRRMREAGAIVRVILTASAAQFVTPLTFQAVSGQPVHMALCDATAEAGMGHIALARWADVIVVAPATADCLARIAQGRADDLLGAVLLASRAPVCVVPAMNQVMWEHPQTQLHCQQLAARGVKLWGPAAGSQACGEIGLGRMLEPSDIVALLRDFFSPGPLVSYAVLLTAGPTREYIDPVRYLSNASSGKMGYAMAAAFAALGARVTLISGPTALPDPANVSCVRVTSAHEMQQAVQQHVANHAIFVSVAAVADYRPTVSSPQKIPKNAAEMTFSCVRNPDILAEVAQLSSRPFVVGFAAETENVLVHAQKKLRTKNVDMMIANRVGVQLGFDQAQNAVTVLTRQGEAIDFPLQLKENLACELAKCITEKFLATQVGSSSISNPMHLIAESG